MDYKELEPQIFAELVRDVLKNKPESAEEFIDELLAWERHRVEASRRRATGEAAR